jgi:hypothetical protein
MAATPPCRSFATGQCRAKETLHRRRPTGRPIYHCWRWIWFLTLAMVLRAVSAA